MFYSRQDAKTLKSAKKPGCIYAAVFFTLISLPSFAEQPTSKESALSGRPEGTERSEIDSRKAAPKGGNRRGASTQAQDSGRPEEVQAPAADGLKAKPSRGGQALSARTSFGSSPRTTQATSVATATRPPAPLNSTPSPPKARAIPTATLTPLSAPLPDLPSSSVFPP